MLAAEERFGTDRGKSDGGGRARRLDGPFEQLIAGRLAVIERRDFDLLHFGRDVLWQESDIDGAEFRRFAGGWT